MDPNSKDIFDSKFVVSLFDEMAHTYGTTNIIASFGFTVIWRKLCVSKVRGKFAGQICDLMTGMGELLPTICANFDKIERVSAIDISPVMCNGAIQRTREYPFSVEILEQDALNSRIKTESLDGVFSSFGLKTFSPVQQSKLASELNRIVRREGFISFIEISVPTNKLFKCFYLFYLNHVIPLIGRILLGNPDCYRMLGTYTKAFGNCRHFARELELQGFEVFYYEDILGCASGVYGSKRVDE